jgi:beta-N-acetylhexosaminidase
MTSGPSATPTPTTPTTSLTGTPTVSDGRDPIRHRIAQMTLRDKVRQLVVMGFSGTRAPVDVIRNVQPGGLIYFSGNLSNPAQIQAMSRAAQRVSRRVGEPLLLMTDQEGGIVTRIPGTQNTPGGADFNGDAAWARHVAVTTGDLLHRLGILVDLAPIADVNTVGSAGVIGSRSFSSDPDVAARLVRAQVCGYHAGGVAATAKHFPGHGSTSTDSHASTALVSESAESWRRIDRPPFQAAVAASVDLVMVGHLAFPSVDPTGRPATLSGPLTHGLLRNGLGYRGVVITDALNMGGVTSWGSPGEVAVRAVSAGVDMLLMSPQPAEAIRALLAAVRSGRLTQARIDTSVERILRLKRRLGLYSAPADLPTC